ncbi:MAG: endolytic transglycosylase MltG [Pseudomonadota bacterium]
MRTIAAIFAGLTGLSALAFAAVLIIQTAFDRSGPLEDQKIVEIPRGAGLSVIARRLEGEDVVSDARLFSLLVSINRSQGSLQAGEFEFPAGVSARGAMDILVDGQAIQYAFTVPEGLTSTQIVNLLNADDRLTGEISVIPPEGALLPETYNFTKQDSSRAEILARMEQAMERALAEVWEQRQDELPLENPAEMVTLASIIEKETGLSDERPLVSSVFINRLNRGIPLQSDPTTIFAITLGKEDLGRPLTRNDLTVESPYNTYFVGGLPPGPIANPGRASLMAAVSPAESNYIFFVADGTGGHAFAETLEEHNRNVAAWRRIRDGG